MGFCTLALVLLGALPAHGIEDGGIGGKPANPRPDNPRSTSIFVYELQPGEVRHDEVQVINNTASEKTLLVYAVDSQIASGGAFSCAQKIDEPLSVGAWITLAKNEVTVAPNSFQNVSFTVNVPQSASAGESNGCIVVQDAQRSATSENGGITLSFRTAIRVAITIPGEISKNLAFTGLTIKPIENQKLRLSAGLKNNGNVSLDSDLRVVVQTLFGSPLKTAGGVFPVLARSEASFNFEVDEPFWGGWYVVSAAATYNADADKSIGQSGTTQTITSSQATIFVAPHPAAALVMLGVVVAIISTTTAIVLRKRHYTQLHRKATTYTVNHGDTLQTIAQKRNLSWQSIAAINKLKAPYHLEAGQQLKIPPPK